MRRLIMLASLALLLPVAASAADWPQFLGPKSNAFTAETGINKDWNTNPPKMLWSTDLSDGGFAGPSVALGKVFIIDHKDKNDVVRAIDLKTGKDVWSYSYEDGKAANYGYSQSTPLVREGKVYTMGRLGMACCLDAKTGKVIWTNNIKTTFSGKSPQWEYAFSPIIDGNQLILSPGGKDAAVVALNKNTGKTIWQGGGSDVPGYTTPAIAQLGNTRMYVILTGVSFLGVDAKTGKLLWTIPYKTAYDINGATPIVMGDTAFITGGYNHGCALVQFSATEAKILWENKDLQSRFTTPLLYEGKVYCTEDPGNLVCMDPKTGKVFWKQPNFEWGGLAGLSDGTGIVFDGRGGDLVMFKLSAEKYQELGRFKPLGGQSWTAPIIADGKLIVRNHEKLACFSLK